VPHRGHRGTEDTENLKSFPFSVALCVSVSSYMDASPVASEFLM